MIDTLFLDWWAVAFDTVKGMWPCACSLLLTHPSKVIASTLRDY